MPRTHFTVMVLAGTALAAVPANAGGLLGGGAANCLCQAVNGLASGGSTSINRAGRGARQPGVVSRGARGKAIANRGNVSRSVSSALAVTVGSSFNRRSAHPSANIGLAGKVSNDSVAAANFNGVSRSVGLAGKSSTHGSASKRVGLTVIGLGTNHAPGLAGKVPGTVKGAPGNAHRASQVANVSVLNKTGTTGRSLANIAVLNGNGGTSGKVANVSVLNKRGTTGRSLVNASVLNGSAGGTGRVANVSVLNGRHGKGHGGLGLPNGVQIINGVPCGPDGTPLTGAAKATVMAMIASNDSRSGGSGKSNNGSGGSSNGSNGGNGSPGAGSGGSQGGSTTGGAGQPRERDMADRKDLWWPPHPQQQSWDGRLNDH